MGEASYVMGHLNETLLVTIINAPSFDFFSYSFDFNFVRCDIYVQSGAMET